jgi:CspA family cold shock protein
MQDLQIASEKGEDAGHFLHEILGGAPEMRMTGKVKWFNDAKGYGFIAPDAGGDDVFVHFSGIRGTGRRSLEEGQDVEFEIANGKKGAEAREVQRTV